MVCKKPPMVAGGQIQHTNRAEKNAPKCVLNSKRKYEKKKKLSSVTERIRPNLPQMDWSGADKRRQPTILRPPLFTQSGLTRSRKGDKRTRHILETVRVSSCAMLSPSSLSSSSTRKGHYFTVQSMLLLCIYYYVSSVCERSTYYTYNNVAAACFQSIWNLSSLFFLGEILIRTCAFRASEYLAERSPLPFFWPKTKWNGARAFHAFAHIRRLNIYTLFGFLFVEHGDTMHRCVCF